MSRKLSNIGAMSIECMCQWHDAWLHRLLLLPNMGTTLLYNPESHRLYFCNSFNHTIAKMPKGSDGDKKSGSKGGGKKGGGKKGGKSGSGNGGSTSNEKGNKSGGSTKNK